MKKQGEDGSDSDLIEDLSNLLPSLLKELSPSTESAQSELNTASSPTQLCSESTPTEVRVDIEATPASADSTSKTLPPSDLSTDVISSSSVPSNETPLSSDLPSTTLSLLTIPHPEPAVADCSAEVEAIPASPSIFSYSYLFSFPFPFSNPFSYDNYDNLVSYTTVLFSSWHLGRKPALAAAQAMNQFIIDNKASIDGKKTKEYLQEALKETNVAVYLFTDPIIHQLSFQDVLQIAAKAELAPKVITTLARQTNFAEFNNNLTSQILITLAQHSLVATQEIIHQPLLRKKIDSPSALNLLVKPFPQLIDTLLDDEAFYNIIDLVTFASTSPQTARKILNHPILNKKLSAFHKACMGAYFPEIADDLLKDPILQAEFSYVHLTRLGGRNVVTAQKILADPELLAKLDQPDRKFFRKTFPKIARQELANPDIAPTLEAEELESLAIADFETAQQIFDNETHSKKLSKEALVRIGKQSEPAAQYILIKSSVEGILEKEHLIELALHSLSSAKKVLMLPGLSDKLDGESLALIGAQFPILGDEILENRDFFSRLNNHDIAILAAPHPKKAMQILNTPELYGNFLTISLSKKPDCRIYSVGDNLATLGAKSVKVALAILKDHSLFLEEENIVSLGYASETALCILNMPALCHKIKKGSSLVTLGKRSPELSLKVLTTPALYSKLSKEDVLELGGQFAQTALHLFTSDLFNSDQWKIYPYEVLAFGIKLPEIAENVVDFVLSDITMNEELFRWNGCEAHLVSLGEQSPQVACKLLTSTFCNRLNAHQLTRLAKSSPEAAQLILDNENLGSLLTGEQLLQIGGQWATKAGQIGTNPLFTSKLNAYQKRQLKLMSTIFSVVEQEVKLLENPNTSRLRKMCRVM